MGCVVYYLTTHSLILIWDADKRQEKIRQETADASGGTGTGSNAPTRHPTEEMDVDEEGKEHDKEKDKDKDGKDAKEGKETSAHPPAKRYRLTEPMKNIIWELVLLSNESCRLENEKK